MLYVTNSFLFEVLEASYSKKKPYAMPGYDIKTPESAKVTLICPECNLLLKDAVQTGDGIRLCESCYKDIARLVEIDCK